jgi:hypothetical protein
MIGNFYPFPVTTIKVGAAFSIVNVRATDAASELANSIEWILWNQSDGQ